MKLHKIYVLSKTQEQYILEMFSHFYADDLEKDPVFPYFDGNQVLFYHSEKPGLQWLMTLFLVSDKLLEDKWTWVSRFHNVTLSLKSQHPVDFLFELYQRYLLKEPFAKKTENQFVLDIENKERNKEQRAIVKKEKEKKVEKEKKEQKKSNKEVKTSSIDNFFE